MPPITGEYGLWNLGKFFSDEEKWKKAWLKKTVCSQLYDFYIFGIFFLKFSMDRL